MRIKVSDYIAEFLVNNGITTVFTVVGGGAMHLNDSFGHCEKLQCIYNHHEQASAIAAEAYARKNNEIAVVCVTSGPGAINALNGVAGAYMDSIPMLVISGQTKSMLTVKSSGLNLRTLGNQEFDIISTLDHMAKYAEMIMDAGEIRFCLEKALYYAKEGRPGPCWLDIPLDIQGAWIETDNLKKFIPPADFNNSDTDEVVDCKIQEIISRLKQAERPVLYAGNGIRISGGAELFHQLVKLWQIPVVTCWNSIDLMNTEDIYYAGRGGTMGDRAGNFAVQNSDLLICIGSRLNIYQVGYNVKTWAREAFTAVVDIDPEELKKPTVRVDLPICYDAGEFIRKLLKIGKQEFEGKFVAWVKQCQQWKSKYPVVTDKHYYSKKPVNVYAFMDQLSRRLENEAITVVANGSASVAGSQAYYIKDKQRFIMNCGLSSMGYDLPAAIGICIANDRKPVICIAGDGSIQMNIQELQTIVTNRLPVKIFVLNNGGYHQIRLTQKNIFQNKLIGIGPESGDLGFPDFERLSAAYGIPYFKLTYMKDLNDLSDKVLKTEGYCLCEVICSKNQAFEPKSATKKLADGSLFSPPLEDLAPFLPRKELKENMYINLVEE